MIYKMFLFVNYRSDMFGLHFWTTFRKLVIFSMCAAYVSTYLLEVLHT